MKTADLQALTLDACTRMQGKLWPNGIGFDRRGWEFRYVESRGAWQAASTTRAADPKRCWGWGNNPEEAQDDARRKRWMEGGAP